MRFIASTTPDAGRWAEVRSGGGQADASPSSTFAASIEDGVGDREPARGSQRSAAGRTKGSFEGDARPAGSMVRPRPSSRTISRPPLLSVASQPSDPSDLGEGEDDVRRRDIWPREDDRERLDEVDPREPEALRSSSLNVHICKSFLPTRSEDRCKAAHEMLGSSSCQRFRPRWTGARLSDGKSRSSVYGSFFSGPETSAGAEAPNQRRGGSPRGAAGRRW
jgi:hypothetical protein